MFFSAISRLLFISFEADDNTDDSDFKMKQQTKTENDCMFVAPH